MKIKILPLVVALLFLCGCGGNTAEPRETIKPTEKPETVTALVIDNPDMDSSKACADAFASEFEALGGTAKREHCEKSTLSFLKILQKAQDEEVAVVYAPVSPELGAILLRDAQQAGLNCPVLSWSRWENKTLLSALPGCSFDVYCTSFCAPLESTGPEGAFQSGFSSWLHSDRKYLEMNGGTDKASELTMSAFDAYNAVMESFQTAEQEKGSKLKSTDVADALASKTFCGLSGEFFFDGNGKAVRSTLYIKKAGDTSMELVKVLRVEHEPQPSQVAAHSSEKASSLNYYSRVLPVGISVFSSDDEGNEANQIELGIRYAQSLTPKVLIDDSSFKVSPVLIKTGDGIDSVTAAKDLAGKGVFAAIGELPSDSTEDTAAVYAQSGIATVLTSVCGEETMTSPWLFQLFSDSPKEGSEMASFAMERVQ